MAENPAPAEAPAPVEALSPTEAPFRVVHPAGTAQSARMFPWRPVGPADATRYDAGEVVEGEGGLIHSYPYTCTL